MRPGFYKATPRSQQQVVLQVETVQSGRSKHQDMAWVMDVIDTNVTFEQDCREDQGGGGRAVCVSACVCGISGYATLGAGLLQLEPWL